jgi:hypothetical protein
MHGIELDYIMTVFLVCNIYVSYVELQQRIDKISFRIALTVRDFRLPGRRKSALRPMQHILVVGYRHSGTTSKNNSSLIT